MNEVEIAFFMRLEKIVKNEKISDEIRPQRSSLAENFLCIFKGIF
jgi:hypothetical protein